MSPSSELFPDETPAEEAPVEQATEAEAPVEQAPEEKAAAKPKEKKLTAAQERDELRSEVAQLREALSKLTPEAVVRTGGGVGDEVVATGGAGGQIRLAGEGRTLISDDWRITHDGLSFRIGRTGMDVSNSFQIPVSLVPSLSEILAEIPQIRTL